jgi:hypothetical protein
MSVSIALEDILHTKARLTSPEDITLEAAMAILAEVSGAVGQTRSLLPSDTQLPTARPWHEVRRIISNVMFLIDPAVYYPETDYRYLVNDQDVLLPIHDVRVAREYTHYRVTLVGSKTPLPVQGVAKAFITEEPYLAGLQLSEVLNQR